MPATDKDREAFGKIQYGETFACKSTDQRNLQHHRKFFALIRLAFDNMPEKFDGYFADENQLRYELIKRAGYFEEYTDFKGNKQYRAKSIAFDKMGQEEFTNLYNRVIDVVIQWLLPDLDRDLLEHEIMNFI